MNLTKTAISRPTAILMLILALVVLGLQGYTRMPAELNPKVDFPYVSVFTTYNGAGPSEIETLISKPIEDAVSSVSGVKNITSVSQQGVSSVSIEFYLGTDLDVAASDVREKVDGVRRVLPDDADAPTISKADANSDPILYFAMRSSTGRSSRDLRDLADNTVKDYLGQVPGVAAVYVTGGDVREIQVSLDRSRLDALGLTVSEVATALAAQNLNVPSGNITEGNRYYSVRVIDEFKSATEIASTRLSFAGKNGSADRTVLISDLGTVRDTVLERTSNAGIAERGAGEADTAKLPNTSDTVSLAIVKTSDGNTVQAAEGVKKQLEALKRIVPADVAFTTTTDQSEEVQENLNDVIVTLALGAFLAVVIVYVFLHNLRGTAIVALAIPTSIISTFLVMYALGFTLNTMTLLGLSLAVGILVDDSIVVLENIFRHLAMGETPQEAAVNGRSEIGLAAVIITLVDVVVFVPVAFMGGIVGQFFRSFGITVAVATLFSLLMSFTLAPMLASRWYRKGEQVEVATGFFGAVNRFYERLEHGYRRALVWALHHRGTVIFIGNLLLVLVILWMAQAGKGAGAVSAGFTLAALILVGSVAITAVSLLRNRSAVRPGARRNWVFEPMLVGGIAAGISVLVALGAGTLGKPLGFRFAPGQDQAQVQLTVELPAGASIAATTRILKQVEDKVRDMPDVKYIETSAGATAAGGFRGGGNTGTQYGQVRLTLKDKLGTLDRIQFWKDSSDLRPRTDVAVAEEVRKRIAPIPGAKIVAAEVSGFNGAAAPVQIQLSGPNLEELVADANKIQQVLENTPGVLSPDISYKASQPEVQVRLDRQKAADLGLSVQQVSQGLQDAVQGNINAKFRDDASGNQYDIRVQYAKLDRSSIADVGTVIVGNRDGSPIRVSDVASVIEGRGPVKIDRRNRQRQVTVSAYLAPGKVIGNMQQVIDPQIKKLNLGRATYSWQGEANSLSEEGTYLIAALGLAILLVYMLMAALFNNVLYPFIIMLSIPQALVGGLLALLISGIPLSIIAMIGVIMLMGLVTKNAILLVDFANTLRSRGYRREDALTEAGPTRLRPILMTTLAQIFGALPIALALGRGSEFRQPLGVVIIGGLTLSALLTLLVIPCTYTVFDDISNWFGRLGRRRSKDIEGLYGGGGSGGSNGGGSSNGNGNGATPTLTRPRGSGFATSSSRAKTAD
ncbi:MAG: efflux RND transporter permease subunit [Cytophagales bacterium]|nr:efflux RND transporter permease subunit [Armatimonadota bacterium]